MKPSSAPAACIGLALFVLFFLLSLDGRLHWDEPYYLYTGGYLDTGDILKGDFQPSGIRGHYTSRIFHVLWIHAIVSVLGLGATALAAVMGSYLLLLLCFLWLTGQIVRAFLPENCPVHLPILFLAFSPVVVYMALKTQPEIPGLFSATLGVFGLVRAMQGKKAGLWLVTASIALCATVYFKNTMVLMVASFVLSVLVFNPPGFPRKKLISYAVVSGTGSVVLFFILLRWMGLALSDYLAVGSAVEEMSIPAPLYVLNILTEGGLLFLALPLAFTALDRGSVRFFGLWFLLSTLPMLIFFRYVEPRFLIMNLPALAGLTALAWSGVQERFFRRDSGRETAKRLAAGIVILCLSGTAYAAQFVMPHEVRWDQFRTIFKRLDGRYGVGNYTILIPWSYTDYHFLRFVYPERDIFNVNSNEMSGLGDGEWKADLENSASYYGSRLLRTKDEIMALQKPIIYLGFKENHTAYNLMKIADAMGMDNVVRRIRSVGLLDHLTTSWMWDSPHFSFKPLFRVDHYNVLEVLPAER
ncbi:MAG: hypothetical protein LJE65_01010 [Desulfobacteraceae bacterium]|nr:hypothetical protein [Desulfobacteraceae bacterium]